MFTAAPRPRAHVVSLLIALALLLLTATARVPAGAALLLQSPAPASPAGALTAGVRETVLPNGLKVLTKEVHNAPVVSFQVWYRVGSRNESAGTTGASHLLEHMLFKGTKRYAVGEISRTLFVNGADFNAGTWYDWTFYYQTLASDRLELAVQLEADRMVNSRVAAGELASEMTVVRSELEGRENDPGEVLRQSVMATAFQAHPYRWPVIGWRSDVENMPRDAVYEYYRTHYGPNNATVVIVGDFQTDAALDLVRRHFGKLRPIPEPPKVYTAEPPQRGERRVVVRRAGALPIVDMAFKAPPVTDPDYYALDLLDTILSSGRASRLYQALVQQGIASSAGTSNPSHRDPFVFTVTATAATGVTAERLETAMLAELERVKNEPVSAEELQRARSQVEAAFIFGADSVSEQANQLGYWETTHTWRYLETYLDRLRALSPADLQRVARKYFTEDTRTVGHFIPTGGGAAPAAAPAREASARVEKPAGNARPIPLPRPAATPKTDRRITRFTMPNGIRVVVQENPSTPTFALVGSLPAGRATEPAPGVAGITASMLTRGTENRSALEFATALESVGASLSASSGALNVSLNGRALSRDFDRLMDLLAEMLRRPAFAQPELERLKGLSLAGLEQEADDPQSIASRAFNRALYPEGHPLRQRTLEEARQAISGITREDVLNFYRRQYGPDNLILVLAGDVTADRVRAALQQRLGDWARNPQARPADVPDVPAGQGGRQVIQVPEKSEATVLWGFAGGLKRTDPDYYAAQVANLVLGGGGALNSRLGDAIRDRQGLVYGVSSFFSADRYAGPFGVFLGTNPGNAQRALAALEAEVGRFRDQGLTQRERDEAVAYLTGSFPVSLETNAGVANVLWEMEYYNLGPDYLDRYAELYRGVTVQAANEAARKHLAPERAVAVLAGTLPP